LWPHFDSALGTFESDFVQKKDRIIGYREIALWGACNLYWLPDVIRMIELRMRWVRHV
jgi:hypothetical protein